MSAAIARWEELNDRIEGIESLLNELTPTQVALFQVPPKASATSSEADLDQLEASLNALEKAIQPLVAVSAGPRAAYNQRREKLIVALSYLSAAQRSAFVPPAVATAATSHDDLQVAEKSLEALEGLVAPLVQQALETRQQEITAVQHEFGFSAPVAAASVTTDVSGKRRASKRWAMAQKGAGLMLLGVICLVICFWGVRYIYSVTYPAKEVVSQEKTVEKQLTITQEPADGIDQNLARSRKLKERVLQRLPQNPPDAL
jgi:hypothetical protein